ncbi:MAG: helix-turn-helix domain-containing protein [Bacteroidota bacterium]
MENQDLYYGFISAIQFIASLHGLALASLLFFHTRFNQFSNRMLALSLLGISIVLIYEFSYNLELNETAAGFFLLLPVYNRSIIPVGIFFFTTSLVHGRQYLTKQEAWWWAPVLLELVLEASRIPMYLWVRTASEREAMEVYYEAIGEGLGLLVTLILLPLSLWWVFRYQRNLYEQTASPAGQSLAWLRRFLMSMLVLDLAWTISFIQASMGQDPEKTFIYLSLGLALFLFILGYFLILQREVFQPLPLPDEPASLPVRKLSTKTEQYHQDLLKLMTEQQRYLEEDLTLGKLSEGLGISPGYLSQVIHEKEGKNFFEFVNAYRVEAVKEKLLDPAFAHYSILGIAYECGFKTKSTFNTAFKKMTGNTPSAFRKKMTEKVPN